MWLFAALLVLVMGGVAAVAAGRGAPLAEEHDDRPDALVPASGPLAGADLRRLRFSLAFRGYRMSEVDALLDRLAGQLEEQERRPQVAEAAETGPDRSDESLGDPGVK
ncbi:DivIVA domain-containing protein [Nocardioides sp. SYSU D00038]|uniref:DivIVA domain-containing protein n=1 Tax=Nocardioides sp. SYSU D00038 TaxID=2812554 RepID=UPI00196779F4|nr:DivIVA domain-containing protein [Nocardioides sp. SYSU D00038]